MSELVTLAVSAISIRNADTFRQAVHEHIEVCARFCRLETSAIKLKHNVKNGLNSRSIYGPPMDSI